MTMSWLSKVLGLDKNPVELAAVNAVGNTILTGVEEASPIAKSLVNVLETVGNTPPTNPISAVSAAGTVVTVLDPKVIDQIETAVNSVLDKLGLSVADKTVDEILVEELGKIGIK